MNLRMVNPQVYYAESGLGAADGRMVDFLVEQARANGSGRCRVCFHPGPESLLHGMLIAHLADVYVPPHFHVDKDESLQVVSGAASLVVFDGQGGVSDVLPLGEPGTGRAFSCRIPAGVCHSLIFESDVFVFQEAVTGPFRAGNMVVPAWAPGADDEAGAKAFVGQLITSIKERGAA
ncbi:WbuC family cupin fold metalloprotein [Fundidesulfovibrio putealis]|uniref:WbuC family cupin fold metalloprotein n=1 Tax=Fundidesulfovibrio putealis TaxID=270496 RepID=UPI0003FBD192|nr:WbuC family cupin fold metalloprotein [Fundidesulfovibrio putealis]